MIARIRRMHDTVTGADAHQAKTYCANDPELLIWVSCHGGVRLFFRLITPTCSRSCLSERDSFNAEGAPIGSHYGAKWRTDIRSWA